MSVNNNKYTLSEDSLYKNNPFNRKDPVPELTIPQEIACNILRHLTPSEVYQFLTIARTEMGVDRFQWQKGILRSKTAITGNELRQCQRIFSLEGKADGTLFSNIELKPWTALANETAASSSVHNSDQKGFSFTNLKHLDLSRDSGSLSAEDLKAILSLCPNLESIDLSFCPTLATTALTELPKHCPKLTSINLSNNQVTNADIVEFAKKCPDLASIDLTKCGQYRAFNALPFTEEGVLALAKHCAKLQSINLSYCNTLTDVGVKALADGCPELISVNFSGLHDITDQGVIYLAKQCQRLSSIDLTAPERSWNGEDRFISDASIFALAAHCPELKSITLSRRIAINDTALIKLAESCPNLSEVGLSDCSQITSEGISALARIRPNLVSIDLSNSNSENIGNASLLALAEHCHHLKSINLSGGYNRFQQDAILALVKVSPNLISLNLEGLNIEGATVQTIAEHCPNLVTINLPHGALDRGVIALTLRCPKLISIGNYDFAYFSQYQIDKNAKVLDRERFRTAIEEMRGLENLSGAQLIAYRRTFSASDQLKSWTWLAKNYQLSLPNLKHLDLSKNNGNLSEEDLIAILKLCPNLTSIHLGACSSQMINTAMAALGTHCKQLTSFAQKNKSSSPASSYDIRYRFSNDAAEALAMGCPDLTSLDLGYCNGITSDALNTIATHCTKLKSIDLSDSHVKDADIKLFADRCPDLVHLDLTRCYYVTDDGIRYLAKKLPNLETIQLAKCQNITDRSIIDIMLYCPKVRKLEGLETNYSTLSKDALIYFAQSRAAESDKPTTARAIKKVVKELIAEEELKVYGLGRYRKQLWGNFDNYFRTREEDVVSWARLIKNNALSLPNLKKLDLQYEEFTFDPPAENSLTSDDIISLLKASPNLESIVLAGGSDLLNSALVALASYCPKISSISLFYSNNFDYKSISNDALEALAQHCPNLATLDLRGWKPLTNENIKIFSNFKNLTRIILNEKTQFEENGLALLGTVAPQELDMVEKTITKEDIEALAKFKNMKTLHLFKCTFEEGASLSLLAKACPNLETLVLEEQDKMTEEDVRALGAFPNLKSIRFKGCRFNDSEKAIVLLSTVCPTKVTAFDRTWLMQVSNDVIRAFATFSNLTSLELNHCTFTGEGGFSLFTQTCPSRLTSLYLAGAKAVLWRPNSTIDWTDDDEDAMDDYPESHAMIQRHHLRTLAERFPNSTINLTDADVDDEEIPAMDLLELRSLCPKLIIGRTPPPRDDNDYRSWGCVRVEGAYESDDESDD